MFWKIARIFVPLFSVFAAGGCTSAGDPAVCPSGLICPAGTICAANQDTCIAGPCGNGIIDVRAGEECDDGNIISGDGCSQNCASDESCGNGSTDSHVGEVCDDGNQQSRDGCSADCRSDESCGNAIVDRELGEVCDDGNQEDGDGCQSTCRSTGQCLNGIVDAPEACDEGGNTPACDSDCTTAHCGDGFTNEAAGEQCDEAGNSSDCDDDCTTTSCGDGFVNPAAGEQCDPASETCSESCKLINCGDHIVDPGEDCDEGGVSTPTCDANCTAVACGDGFVNSTVGEECDTRGNTANCDADCTLQACGDSFVNPVAGEQCEAGGAHTPACDADCTMAVCGDSVHNPLAGELCDDGGNSPTCDADCTPRQCPDGFLNVAGGEQCDEGGNTSTCDADCTAVRCGDGFSNPANGESCDAGGQNTVTCDADCTLPVCGDGLRNPAANEQCDTGGNSSSCDADCTLRVCGDQFINPVAGEDCDDGNASNNDACVLGCQDASCGDGYLYTGVEECEDGNLVNTDNCTAACELADCADGFRNANESDVDCGGHCGASCEALQSCSTDEDCLTGVCLGGICVPDWSRLATGSNHTCALLASGAVRCWGWNHHGELGYGNRNDVGDNETPASVGDVNVGGTVIQVAAGYAHTCALLDSGSVRCWGYGGDGNLGYGNTQTIGDDETPASAGNVNVGGTVVQIAAGQEHTCALLDSGSVRCWGDGGHGRLGYGNAQTIGDDETPASVGNVNVGGTVIQIAAGADHTCALLDSGSVRCWGYGYLGRLGYGNTQTIGDNETPASVGNVNVGGTVIQIAAGLEHTCALLDSGSVRCWGYGDYGRLGYGSTQTIGDNETPASAGDVDLGGSVIQIAAGGAHTCALLDSGAVRCWGQGYDGRLGYGNTNSIGDNETPESAGDVDVGGSIISGIAGFEHAGHLPDAEAAHCWSDELLEHLGYGNACYIAYDEILNDAPDL